MDPDLVLAVVAVVLHNRKHVARLLASLVARVKAVLGLVLLPNQ